MNLVRLIDFLRDRLQTVIRVCYAILALLVVLDIARVLLSHEHHEAAEAAHEEASGFWASLYHVAETWPVFWSVFGFVACVLIVYVSKAYGHAKVGKSEIMTREDYYNE